MNKANLGNNTIWHFSDYSLVRSRSKSRPTSLAGYLIKSTDKKTFLSVFSSNWQINKAKIILEHIKRKCTREHNVFDVLDERFFNLLSTILSEERIINMDFVDSEIRRCENDPDIN